MAFMLRLFSAFIFLTLPAVSSVGQPLPSASSTQEAHSRIRLLTGGQMEDQWLAGIEITLAPGFKTYWRNPGESGLPPRFDWSGSENVAQIDIRWPAPVRHEDAAGVANVYSGKVLLPVLVKAKEPGKPVRLVLTADYGICKDICIPAHGEMKADLPGAGQDRAAIEAALAKVPRSQPLGAKVDLSVVSVQPLDQNRPGLSVTVSAPDGTRPALFAEGPEDWYVSTTPAGAGNRFEVTVDEKPKGISGPVSLRLTLVAGERAIETDVSLDGSGWPRY